MAAVATAVLAAAIVLALPAGAPAETPAAGSSRIELSRGLFRQLERQGVEVAKAGLGTVRGRTVSLPVEGGLIDLPTALGSLGHAGGFRFRSGRRTATLRQLVLDTSKRELYGKLDGRRVRVATGRSFSFSRVGFGAEVEIGGLRLSRQAASILNRKLDLNGLFRPARPFAAVSSGFQPEAGRLSSGSMQFSLDPGFVAKLKTLEVEAVPFATDVLGSDPPTFGAPLLGGEINLGASRSWGYIEGGIRLTRLEAPEPGSHGPALTLPTLTWANLGLSLETQEILGGIVAHDERGQIAPWPGGPIAAVDFSVATMRLDLSTRTWSVANARAALEATTANLINETFATPKGKAPVLAAGDPLGTFSLTLQAR